MPDIIYRPNGDTDLANAEIVAETGLPQTIAGVPGGAYQVGRVQWDGDVVTVTDPPGSVNWVALNGVDNWLGNFAVGGAAATQFTLALPIRFTDRDAAGTSDIFRLQGNIGEITCFRFQENFSFYAEEFNDAGLAQAIPSPDDVDIGFMFSVDLAGGLPGGAYSQTAVNGNVVSNITAPAMSSFTLAAIGLLGKEGAFHNGGVGGWVAMGETALDLNAAYGTYFDANHAPRISPAAAGMTLFVDDDAAGWNASGFVNGAALSDDT